jgi:hypothetical protein
MTPLSQRKACFSPLAVVDSPTIWPLSLMVFAALELPPRVPKSIIEPFSQRNAWFAEVPTTWPELLRAVTFANGVPERPPRSVTV